VSLRPDIWTTRKPSTPSRRSPRRRGRRCFRRLVAAHPSGLPAGEIARPLDVPHNTLSAHLAVLARADLISASRAGRTIRYRAELDGIRALVAFLTGDCCSGHPEVCAPPVADLSRSACLLPAKHEVRHD